MECAPTILKVAPRFLKVALCCLSAHPRRSLCRLDPSWSHWNSTECRVAQDVERSREGPGCRGGNAQGKDPMWSAAHSAAGMPSQSNRCDAWEGGPFQGQEGS